MRLTSSSDVDAIVGALKVSLETVVSEEKLLGIITERLAGMRKAFATQRSLFLPDSLEFLMTLRSVSETLQSFIELKEELAYVDTLEEHTSMGCRLNDLQRALAAFAVGKRVGKEIREFREKLPRVREQERERRSSRERMAMTDIEQSARERWAVGHGMVIRQGPNQCFWGCSRFPLCMLTKQLAPEEKKRLEV